MQAHAYPPEGEEAQEGDLLFSAGVTVYVVSGLEDVGGWVRLSNRVFPIVILTLESGVLLESERGGAFRCAVDGVCGREAGGGRAVPFQLRPPAGQGQQPFLLPVTLMFNTSLSAVGASLHGFRALRVVVGCAVHV